MFSLPFVSIQVSSDQNVMQVVIPGISASLTLSEIGYEEAKKELSKYIEPNVLASMPIHKAYRGRTGSLICLMGISVNVFQLLTCSKDTVAKALKDFNWFWGLIHEKIGDFKLQDFNSAPEPSVWSVIKNPFIVGLLTNIVWFGAQSVSAFYQVTGLLGTTILPLGAGIAVLILSLIICYVYWRLSR